MKKQVFAWCLLVKVICLQFQNVVFLYHTTIPLGPNASWEEVLPKESEYLRAQSSERKPFLYS